jgi:hypothetical protein
MAQGHPYCLHLLADFVLDICVSVFCFVGVLISLAQASIGIACTNVFCILKAVLHQMLLWTSSEWIQHVDNSW